MKRSKYFQIIFEVGEDMLYINSMNTRQLQLLEKLARTGRLDAGEEAKLLGVSAMTLWRDFKSFEEKGLALRTHGGLVTVAGRTSGFLDAAGSSVAQKKIAAAAVSMIKPRATIMLSTGTTTLEVARQLASSRRTDVTVITSSLRAAAIFYQTDFSTILLGGSLRRNAMDLTGPIAEKNLDDLHIDMLFTGCDGAVSREGFFTSDLSIAELERKSVARSGTVVVVTESKKFGRRALAKFADPKDVRTVITDSGISRSDRLSLEKDGIEVRIAR